MEKSCSLRRSLESIDSVLMKQAPPDQFTRAPRCMKSHMKYWKASKLKQWLLYYSLSLLQNNLLDIHWLHFSLLVSTMHILLKDSVTFSELDAAEIIINDFLKLFPVIYGKTNCTHNVHILSHVPTYVHLWCPLWTHSPFCFKNKKRFRKKSFSWH